MSLTIKIVHPPSGVTRKVLLKPYPPPAWERLAASARSRFGLQPEAVVGLRYIDPEGDAITISSQPELDDLWEEFKAGAKLKEKEGFSRSTVRVELVDVQPCSTGTTTFLAPQQAQDAAPPTETREKQGLSIASSATKDDWEDTFSDEFNEAIRLSNLETERQPSGRPSTSPSVDNTPRDTKACNDASATVNDPPEELPEGHRRSHNMNDAFAPVLATVFQALEAAGPEILCSVKSLVGSVLIQYFGEDALGKENESLPEQIRRVWREREAQLRNEGGAWIRGHRTRPAVGRPHGMGRRCRGLRRHARSYDDDLWTAMFGNVGTNKDGTRHETTTATAARDAAENTGDQCDSDVPDPDESAKRVHMQDTTIPGLDADATTADPNDVFDRLFNQRPHHHVNHRPHHHGHRHPYHLQDGFMHPPYPWHGGHPPHIPHPPPPPLDHPYHVPPSPSPRFHAPPPPPPPPPIPSPFPDEARPSRTGTPRQTSAVGPDVERPVERPFGVGFPAFQPASLAGSRPRPWQRGHVGFWDGNWAAHGAGRVHNRGDAWRAGPDGMRGGFDDKGRWSDWYEGYGMR